MSVSLIYKVDCDSCNSVSLDIETDGTQTEEALSHIIEENGWGVDMSNDNANEFYEHVCPSCKSDCRKD